MNLNDGSRDQALDYAEGDEAFAAWLREVDEIVGRKLQVGIFDLPDLLYRDAFDAGTTPEEYVRENVAALVRDGFGEEAAELLLAGLEREED